MTAGITLTDAITALVTEKRAVGYKYHAEQQVLARFEAFSRGQFPGLDTLTEASVQAWIIAARRRDVQPATLQGLAAPVRELARWLGRRGAAAYLLPTAALPRPARYIPHIYTDRELAALFTQTDRCHYCCQVPLRHLGDAGAVPHDLRLRSALLRGPPAPRRRCRHRRRGAANP